MCPFVFFAGTFFPQALGFLEPFVCPHGLHLDNETLSQSDLRGNTTATYTICTDGHQEVDVTGKILLILFGLAILGGILLIVWALQSDEKSKAGVFQ
jgi:hypothetical protein